MTKATSMMRPAFTWVADQRSNLERAQKLLIAGLFNLCRSSNWLFIFFNKSNICRSQQRMLWWRQLPEERQYIWFESFSQKLCLYFAPEIYKPSDCIMVFGVQKSTNKISLKIASRLSDQGEVGKLKLRLKLIRDFEAEFWFRSWNLSSGCIRWFF